MRGQIILLALLILIAPAQLAAAQTPDAGPGGSYDDCYPDSGNTEDPACPVDDSDDEAWIILALFFLFVLASIGLMIGYAWSLIQMAQGASWTWFVITLIFPPTWIVWFFTARRR